MASVDLQWDANAATDNVATYQIERRPIGPTQRSQGWRNGLRNLVYAPVRNIAGGWRRVGEVPGTQNNFNDGQRFLARRIFRPTYWHNSEILPYQSYEYRIRPISNQRAAGPWTFLVINPPGGAGNGVISGRVVIGEADPAHPGQNRVIHMHAPLPVGNPADAAAINDPRHAVGVNAGATQVEVIQTGTANVVAHGPTNAAGEFAITIPAGNFGQDLELRIAAIPAQNLQAGTSRQGWPQPAHIRLDAATNHFDNAVVPMLQGGGGGGVEGEIRGRIVRARRNAAGNLEVIATGTALPLPGDVEARVLHANNTRNIGIAHEVIAMVGAPGTPIGNARAGPDGRFTIQHINHTNFGQDITLVSQVVGRTWRQGTHDEGHPHGAHIRLDAAHPVFEFAIVPKERVGRAPPPRAAALVMLHTPAPHLIHNTPLQAAFGGTPLFPNPGDHVEIDFVLQGIPRSRRHYHVFFYSPRLHRNVSAAELHAQYGLNNIVVDFTQGAGGPANPAFNDPFYHQYSVHGARVRIRFDCANPPALAMPVSLLAFVVVQDAPNLANQNNIDEMIREHAMGAHNHEPALRAAGILDFNFNSVIIHP